MTAEPGSRSCVRIVRAVLSGCGLAALARASFVPPAAHIIYNPSDSVPIGWYRIRPTGPTHIGSIVLARLPADVAALAAARGSLPSHLPHLKQIGRATCRERVCQYG